MKVIVSRFPDGQELAVLDLEKSEIPRKDDTIILNEVAVKVHLVAWDYRMPVGVIPTLKQVSILVV